MAHAHRRADGRFGRVDEPVEALGVHLGVEQLLPKRQLDRIRSRVDARDIHLAPVHKAGAALADGVAENAVMLPDDRTVQHKIARPGQGRALCHPVYIILIRDEADLHAVGLVRDGETECIGQSAHLRLFIIAERQQQTRHLFARQAAEHVALVVRRHTFI